MSSFKITIEQTYENITKTNKYPTTTETIYTQIVDRIDIPAVIAVINAKNKRNDL